MLEGDATPTALENITERPLKCGQPGHPGSSAGTAACIAGIHASQRAHTQAKKRTLKKKSMCGCPYRYM